MCQSGYVNGSYFFYRVSQYWASPSQIQSRALTALTYAMDSWSNSPGPQYFVGSSNTSTPYTSLFVEEYPYFAPADQPDKDALNAPSAAVTVNHSWNGSTYAYCYDSPCIVSYGEVYVNDNWDSMCSGGLTAGVFQFIFAHEFGHTQGLADHGSGSILMNNHFPTYCNQGNGGVNGPTSSEIGATPACSGPLGIRCIYGWPY